jgi:hypothetical protein
MLSLLVICYLGLPFVTIGLGMRASRTRPALRVSLWMLLGAELLYSLFAPACVYLPWVPGQSVVTRSIVGVDSDGHVYWQEMRSRRFSFEMGPRWWVGFNAHTLSPYGGLEWIPPLRFARYDQGAPSELVRYDGTRRPLPLCQARGALGAQLPLATASVRLRRDGVFVLGGPGEQDLFLLDANMGTCSFLSDTASRLRAPDRPTGSARTPVYVEMLQRTERGGVQPQRAYGAGTGRAFMAYGLDPFSGAILWKREVQPPPDIAPEQVESLEVFESDRGYLMLTERQVVRGETGWETLDDNAVIDVLDDDLGDPTRLGSFQRSTVVDVSPDGRLLSTLYALYTTDGMRRAVFPRASGVVFGGSRLLTTRHPILLEHYLRTVSEGHAFGRLTKIQADAHRSAYDTVGPELPWTPVVGSRAPRPFVLWGGWDESGAETIILELEASRLPS